MTLKEFKELVSTIPEQYDEMPVEIYEDWYIEGEHCGMTTRDIESICAASEFDIEHFSLANKSIDRILIK